MSSAALPRAAFYGVGVALAAVAALAMVLAPPAGQGLAGALCGRLPLAAALEPALLWTAGWTLMLVAMMLPTALPVLYLLHRMTAARADGPWLVALAAGGYLGVWIAFGIAAHFVLGLADQLPRGPLPAWAITAATLAVAGAFQFSALKRRCLEKCRSPLGLVITHWHGRRPAAEALGLGLRHGAFCVGCCWALMAVMLAVGGAGLGVMLVLGLVMAAEKNLPEGWRLSAPTGIALLTAAATVLALNL